jgi:hypothetical protein
MYLPFETTFAIFLGGVFRSFGDWLARRRGFNDAQLTRVDNTGVLVASGLIAGESIFGLLWAGLIAISLSQQPWMASAAALAARITKAQIFANPSYLLAGMIMLAALAALMILLPLTSAGDPNEPAPPTAMM